MTSKHQQSLARRIYDVYCQLDVVSSTLEDSDGVTPSLKDGIQSILWEASEELQEVEEQLIHGTLLSKALPKSWQKAKELQEARHPWMKDATK